MVEENGEINGIDKDGRKWKVHLGVLLRLSVVA